MPLGSLFSSLNCASSRSSKLKRRTSRLNRRQKDTDGAENELDNRPQAPPSQSSHSLARKKPTAPSSGDDYEAGNQSLSDKSHHSLKLLRMDSVFQESFWDIGNYKYTLKRCDNGSKLASELAAMISERAKLEDAYAKSIKQWSKRWYDHLQNESTEYESTKDTWYAFLDAGNRTADIHSDLCKELVNRPVLKINDWQKKKYEKHLVNFKQTKEFEKDFEIAQKSWFDLNEKLKKAKKEYYESIKATKTSEETAREARSNPKISQDQRDKLDEKSKRSREEQEKAQQRYKDVLKEMDIYKPHHMEQMGQVFNKTQNFEKERMLFFKQTFKECLDILAQSHQDDRYDQLIADYLNVINNVDPESDLAWWSNNFGIGTRPNWPVYEEYQERSG